MYSILFVDDEPNILHGLNRSLRSLRHEWKMDFVDNGSKAIDFVTNNKVDIIVSDMRMPGMNGADLLAYIQQYHPLIVRIILSGQATHETIIKAASSAQYYITKPCTTEILISCITQACKLIHSNLNTEDKVACSKTQYLPRSYRLTQQIISSLSNPSLDIEALTEIVKKDISMASKALHLVNTGFFGNSNQICSIAEVTGILGVDILRELYKESIVHDASSYNQYDPFLLPIEQHSVKLAELSFSIAAASDFANCQLQATYTAALLHKVGDIIKVKVHRDKCASNNGSLENASLENLTHSADNDRLVNGSGSSSIEAYMLMSWGLPGIIIDSVMQYSQPNINGVLSPQIIIHIAQTIINRTEPTYSQLTDKAYLETLGFNEGMISKLMTYINANE